MSIPPTQDGSRVHVAFPASSSPPASERYTHPGRTEQITERPVFDKKEHSGALHSVVLSASDGLGIIPRARERELISASDDSE